MSYILNALRKSEQERRTAEIPELGTSIIETPSDPKNRFKWLLVSLVALNGLVIGYFVWSRHPPQNPQLFNPQSQATPKISVTQSPTFASSITDNQVKPPQPPEQPSKLQPTADKPGLAKDLVSISELMKADNKLSVKRDLPEKDRDDINPPKQQSVTSVPAVPTDIDLSQLTPKQDSNRKTEDPRPTTDNIPIQQRQKIVSDESTRPEHIPENQVGPENDAKEAPLLRTLNPEFRRQVPKLKINVFVYDNDPAERFVLIDMKKYTAGQSIAEQMKLEEILNDSLLVKFKGKKFRIKRP